MSHSAWGDEKTRFFFELTPDRILSAFEKASGLRATGRSLALNSMENRVYDVEIEVEEGFKGPSYLKSRIVKFYRPGRWSYEQLREEHAFLKDLIADEVPVAAPAFFNGESLFKDDETQLYFTVFPKVGGRSPYELDDGMLEIVGRLLARLHNVGALKKTGHRICLTPDTYGKVALSYLLKEKKIPPHHENAYKDVVNRILDAINPLFEGVETFRIHGDCHLGNLLWGDSGPFFVDFDDFVRGPAVQDFWLLIPGRDEAARDKMDKMLRAYGQFRDFPYETLNLIEPLRALRFIHFTAWISKRWQDPAFPLAFPDFDTDRYWQQQIADLNEQLQLISGGQPRALY